MRKKDRRNTMSMCERTGQKVEERELKYTREREKRGTERGSERKKERGERREERGREKK